MADGPTPSLGRVLILFASARAGHVRAAHALERALALAGATTEVRHVDVLQYTTKLSRRLYAKAYLDLVTHAPEVRTDSTTNSTPRRSTPGSGWPSTV